MSTQSQCDIPSVPYHTLSCTHTILPCPTPITSSTKSPCSPNCHRAICTLKPQLPFSWFKNTCPLPFICPACVEDCVRADYGVLMEQQRRKGEKVATEKETNVRIWTYKAICEMMEEGGRGCEVVWDGRRRMGGELRTWEVRHDASGVGNRVAEGGEIDVDDASQMALLRAGYSEQDVKRSEELDELAERLADAKVGMGEGDGEMDLVFELGGMET